MTAAGAGVRSVGPPPRPGMPYQPTANFPTPPPMMIRPPQIKTPVSNPSYNDPGAATLQPPGKSLHQANVVA